MALRRRSLGLQAAGMGILLAGAASPAQEREVRLGFLGDTGTGDQNQRMVRDQLSRLGPSYVFLLGDNIYSDGRRGRFGPRFDEVYAPVVARGSRFFAALGNHDVRDCAAATVRPLPPTADAYRWREADCYAEDHLAHAPFGYVGQRRYYSVTLPAGANPLVEVFLLDSNTLGIADTKLKPSGDDQAQMQWLDGALAASRAHWKVVGLHHPPHTPVAQNGFFGFGSGRIREVRLENQIAPVLRRHAVDVVFSAHNHFYARMVPQDGTRYFVAGGGGRQIYGFQPAPGYVAAGGVFLHFVYVRATESRFEYYAIDGRGRSRDAGWFAKGDGADHIFPPTRAPS